MASTSDIRDIMNLGQAGPRQPAPKKKKKHNEPQVRMSGINREIQALMGDSVPPIAIVEHPQYKSRPSLTRSFIPRHWGEKEFKHGGRTDGLVLKHWKRAIPGSNRAPTVATTSVDVEMTDDSRKQVLPAQDYQYEDDFPSHKWNVSLDIPTYSDEQYHSLLKSDDWTKQETDYLMELCRTFDLRWLLIADRYDEKSIPAATAAPQVPSSTSSDIIPKPAYPSRSMEALKSRYYGIAAKMLEIQTPASNMTQSEFQLWEKMRNFDVKTETLRKTMAEKLFERTKDEADEERILLEELHRITKNEDDFIKARKELYTRLEPVLPTRRTERGEEQSTAMYQTSGGLSMLLQSLLAKEKRMKRPQVPGSAETAPASATPTEQKPEKSRPSNQNSRRDTIDTQTEEATPVPQKKGSAAAAPPNIRVLTPSDEAKFGVSHPQERLTSGVQFRHEKINRLTMAKSQTQTTKIQAALTELGIPPRLLMPTERVCREFERLTTEINILLDARKVNEKLSTEIKILEEARRIRLGLPKEGDEGSATNATVEKSEAMDIDSSQLVETSQLETVQDNATTSTQIDNKDGSGDIVQKKKAPELAIKQADKTQDNSAKSVDQVDESTMQVEDDNSGAVDDAAGEENEEVSQTKNGEKSAADSDNDNGEEEDEEDEDREDTGVADDSDNEKEGNGAAVDEDEDEEEDEEQEETQVQLEDEDEDEEDNDEPQLGVDDDDDEEEEEEEEQEDEEEEDDDDEAAVVPETPDEDDEEGDEDEDAEAEAENDEEDEDEGDEDAPTPASGEAQQEDEEEEEEDEEDEAEAATEQPVSAPPTHLTATAPRSHKRSASVVSESSKAGSNRSGLGRKKRR